MLRLFTKKKLPVLKIFYFDHSCCNEYYFNNIRVKPYFQMLISIVFCANSFLKKKKLQV